MDYLFDVAAQFTPASSSIAGLNEYGNGNINNTYLVEPAGEKARFILQRVNTRVFRRPELVLRNMRVSMDHMRRKLLNSALNPNRRWEIPNLLLTRDGHDHWIASDGSFWRALSFIESARSFDIVLNFDHAREVGCGLGIFHMLLSDLPSDRLADTLEGFHVTPCYIRHYEEVFAKYHAPKFSEVKYCLEFVKERSAWASLFEDARREGRLFLRPIHGDPKVNNILLDTVTGQAASIIDLDTVKPGLVHYDIGDCLRSGCNPLGEETDAWEMVRFDTDLCRAVLQGYLSLARKFLTDNDIAYVYDSIRMIAFELGLRFFTDYLEGNVYFRVKRPEHNLVRALVQFRLTESIESQEREIRSIVRESR